MLKQHCIVCHGPAKQEAGLNLATPPGIRRGGPMGASAVVARAFSYATDSDGDREITAVEVQAAAKKWSADGDKNTDGTPSPAEISLVIEGFIKSMPAPRSRRR